MAKLLPYLTTAIEEQVAKRRPPIFGTKLKGCRYKLFHVLHSLQSVMAFRVKKILFLEYLMTSPVRKDAQLQ